MEYKSKVLTTLTLSILGSVTGYFLSDPSILESCRNYPGCNSMVVGEYIGVPLLLFSVVFAIISLVLLFARDEIFRSWSKFARIFLPIAAILIILSPSQPSFLNPDRELTTWWMAGLFLVISILLIAWKWRRTSSPNAALK